VKEFELLLFYKDVLSAHEAIDAGVNGIILDWESKGKTSRQISYDTQISVHNKHTLLEARQLNSNLICRVNGFPFFSEEEVKTAIDAGANEILLPMVRSPHEIEHVLHLINGQCAMGILVETTDATQRIEELVQFPLKRVYVGLNDLHIDSKSANLFEPFRDGSLDRLRASCPLHFGIAGLTHPNAGSPIPCHLLLGEMVRLNTNFSFLRRSYYHALKEYSAVDIVESIHNRITILKKRTDFEIAEDRKALYEKITCFA
jgi:hypothetical protein